MQADAALAAAHRNLTFCLLVFGLLCSSTFKGFSTILWSDLGATLVHDTGLGADILGGAVKRDDTSSDTLYFKFHVNPLSDVSTEPYFAGLQLFEGDTERVGIGNALEAWAYSAFNAAETSSTKPVAGDFDFNSSHPDFDPNSSRTNTSDRVHAFWRYEFPRRGIERTIVFKIQFVQGGADLVTVYLDPDLAPGAAEGGQPETLTTRFTANASFDQIRLRHTGGGPGWVFSDMAIATSFSDLIPGSNPEPGSPGPTAHNALSFSFRSWQREQGLPQNLVHTLVQTRDGYLWIGTDDGIARFDGIRFVSFGWREGVRSVRHLFEDSRGALWIGSVGAGLTRLQDGKFTSFTSRDGLLSDSITAMAEDASGRLWVGTEAGINIWDVGHWTSLTNDPRFKGRPITGFYKDHRGDLWFGAAGAGVFQVRQGSIQQFTDPLVENLLLDTHCLLVDHSGRIWLGAGDDFLLCRDGNEWRRYRIPRHLARPYITALAESPDGTIWAGSVSEGLFQFKQGKLQAINASSGLLDNFVESLLVDREGNLWVGTSAGLSHLRRKNVSAFGPDEGLGYGPVQGLAELADGTIWAAKPGDGLYRWDGRAFSRVTSAGLPRFGPRVNALLTARDGSCWVAAGQGLWNFPQPETTPEELPPPILADRDILSLAQERDGVIWAGAADGTLWKVQNRTASLQTNFIQSSPITALLPDIDGLLWVGTDGAGLYRFRGTIRAHYAKSAQNQSSGPLSDFIRTLYRDTQGDVWIGTAGGGLTRYQDGKFTTFTSREGIPDDTVSQIMEDNLGRLWLGSNRGIASVARRDLEELAEGKVVVVYPRIYGRAEGMLSEECTGGFCPAGLRTKSGLLWFSTLKGIVAVDPRPRTTDAPAPSVVLEEVLVDSIPIQAGQPFSASPHQFPLMPGDSRVTSATNSLTSTSAEGLQISPGRHRLELRYTGLSFSAPERVRFRYRLENLDAEWIEAGSRRAAFYSYVPPGKYRFEVIACNSDGVWSQAGPPLSLQVLPYFWQNRWFIGLAALGLLATVGGASRLVEQRKHQRRLSRIEQERALERERARIAQDLHDDLGSSLTRISLLSALAKADKDNPLQVEVHADKISQSAAHTVRALEEIVWAVRPGSDSLQSLVEYITHFANEMFSGSSTHCRLDIPHDLPSRTLPPEMRHNIFLIVKEALTNALKHSGAREVTVAVKSFSDGLQLRVQDDGKGFTPSAFSESSTRNGLGNMRQRAESIGAALALESAPGGGTSVTLRVHSLHVSHNGF